MTGPTVTLAEAARRSHLSIATLRRWVKANKFPSAVQTDAGWSIPIAELVAAGALKGTTDAPADGDDDHDGGDDHHVVDLERQLADANSQNRELRAELGRADQNLDDLRTAMRMLQAAPQDRGPRKRWYRRSTS